MDRNGPSAIKEYDVVRVDISEYNKYIAHLPFHITHFLREDDRFIVTAVVEDNASIVKPSGTSGIDQIPTRFLIRV